MSSIGSASLSDDERTLLDAFVRRMTADLDVPPNAIWLFGSRARGEGDHEDSDVDLLLLVEDDSWGSKQRIRTMLHETSHALGVEEAAWSFSLHIHTPQWLRQRREIRSFFICEVDRDKVVVAGWS